MPINAGLINQFRQAKSGLLNDWNRRWQPTGLLNGPPDVLGGMPVGGGPSAPSASSPAPQGAAGAQNNNPDWGGIAPDYGFSPGLVTGSGDTVDQMGGAQMAVGPGSMGAPDWLTNYVRDSGPVVPNPAGLLMTLTQGAGTGRFNIPGIGPITIWGGDRAPPNTLGDEGLVAPPASGPFAGPSTQAAMPADLAAEIAANIAANGGVTGSEGMYGGDPFSYGDVGFW